MLRSEHSLVRYDFRTMQVCPDRLHRQSDAAYLPAARDLLEIYCRGIDRTRQDLHQSVADRLCEIAGCPPRRAAAFCKLLDDLSEYKGAGQGAAGLRRRVFAAAAKWHPVVSTREGIFEHDIESARAAVAAEVGLSWPAIEQRLFSDVVELQTLRLFPADFAAEDLLARYNVAQTQAALYRATAIRVETLGDFKTIVRQAKLSGLMHRIEPISGPDGMAGYRFHFDGAGSALRGSTRYGIGFAKLLDCLLACRRWRMLAEVLGPQRQRFQLRLSPRDGLRGTFERPEDFDSQLERDVQAAWDKEPVPPWRIDREGELLHRGQIVMTPDFVLRDSSGRKLYLEVVGFWTSEYLRDKAERLRMFVEHEHATRWLLLFAGDATTKRQTLGGLAIPHIVFSPKQSPREWLVAAGFDADQA